MTRRKKLEINKLYNNEAEMEVLGILLVDNSKAPQIKAMLSSLDFFTKPHQQIYSTIIDMVDAGKTADIVTVSEQLDFDSKLTSCGGRGYVNDLALNVTSISNYKNYCKIILNYSKKRKLISVFENGIEKLSNNVDVADVASECRSQVEDVIVNKTSDNLTHISAGAPDVLEQVEKIMTSENKILGIPTPYTPLNKALSGLVKGRLYILGARPSMGKSAMAMQIANTIAVNYNVVFASLEMSVAEYAQRQMFSMCNTNQDLISSGCVSDDIYEKLVIASAGLETTNLYVIDDAGCTLSTIENGIINCINKNGSCDLVIVDYLQLMGSDDRRKKDDYDIVTYNSKGLKKLARKYNIPILALCQLSRGLESRQDKRPVLSDLRDSGSIEQDADVVMFLYRDEYYNPTGENKGHAELIVRKNRQGRNNFAIDFIFEASRTRFSNGREL
jgi:replicative DNA helicase